MPTHVAQATDRDTTRAVRVLALLYSSLVIGLAVQTKRASISDARISADESFMHTSASLDEIGRNQPKFGPICSTEMLRMDRAKPICLTPSHLLARAL